MDCIANANAKPTRQQTKYIRYSIRWSKHKTSYSNVKPLKVMWRYSSVRYHINLKACLGSVCCNRITLHAFMLNGSVRKLFLPFARGGWICQGNQTIPYATGWSWVAWSLGHIYIYIYIYIHIYIYLGSNFQVPGPETWDLPASFQRKKRFWTWSSFGVHFWSSPRHPQKGSGSLWERFWCLLGGSWHCPNL